MVYEMTWRNKELTGGAETIDDMIKMLQEAADTLRKMRDAGITLEPDGGAWDDYAHLVTKNPDVAKQFRLEPCEEPDEEEELDNAECRRAARFFNQR
jgi:hypothetical protein